MILRARIVLPVARPPIEAGAVQIAEDRIIAVERWRDLRFHAGESVYDLGDHILLPGLINAHCHLDYTALANQVPFGLTFTEWLQNLVRLKKEWSDAEFALSWLQGARMLRNTGTTTVADIESAPALLPQVWALTPLRVISFFELIGLNSSEPPGALLNATVKRLAALDPNRDRTGLAPHALYTNSVEWIRDVAHAARDHQWRWTLHLAESQDEWEMFHDGCGPLYDWLKEMRDMSDCTGVTPVGLLAQAGLLDENLVAVHANCLDEEEPALLGRQGVHLVHCPRSHDYFGHPPFPLRALLDARVNLCLGTDSLAGITPPAEGPLELNLFAEMQALARNDTTLPPEQIVQMATVNAAKALNRVGQLGELSENAYADLIAVPWKEGEADPYAQVVHHPGHVSASVVGGQWVILPQSR